MIRDNQRCFVSRGLDHSAYYYGMPIPTGVTGVVYCRIVSIVPAELLSFMQNQVCHISSSNSLSFTMACMQHLPADLDIMWGMLQRFCGIPDTAMLAQKAHGPANTLLVHLEAALSFNDFIWWLCPTEVGIIPLHLCVQFCSHFERSLTG